MVTLRGLHLNASRVVLAVTLVMALVHFAGVVGRGVRPRVVRGDAVHYYVQLRSAVFDHDLDFANDYDGLYTLDFKISVPPPGFTVTHERTVTGHVRNFMPVGPALLWAPLFLVVTGATYLLSIVGLAYSPDGYGLALQLVPDVCGVAAAGLAMWFTYLLVTAITTPRAALGATLAILAGSPLIYYAIVSPAYSHALSAMGASAFLLYWWNTRDRTDLRRYAAVGALAGLTALIRWQDGLLLATVLLDVVAHARAGRLARGRLAVFALSRLAIAGAAALIVFSPQMIVWQVLYGQPLTIPQGAGFVRWTASQVTAVLFSPYRGLFSWTPLTAVGIAGLVALWKKQPRLVATLALFFVVSTYINGAVADWWAGEAFGARRYLSCFPIFAVGLAALLSLDGIRGVVARVAAVCLAVANLFLLLHYEVFLTGLTALAPYPDNWYTLWVERFLIPLRLAAHVLHW
ncbi:MAG: hypothetical protein WCP29_04500 [Acidobacteriota bacterium]